MNITQIIEKLKTDPAFATKYTALKNTDAVLEQAKKDGFDVTREDVETAMREMGQKTGELTEADLALVSGGGGDTKDEPDATLCLFTDSKEHKNGRIKCSRDFIEYDGGNGCMRQRFEGWYRCCCHGTERCVDFWHLRCNMPHI